jgi:hypothetical protein
MTVDLMEQRVKNDWERRPKAISNPPSTFVLEAFRGLWLYCVIHGGMTSPVQPLDAYIITHLEIS